MADLRIVSGPPSEKMWEYINTARTVANIRDALYFSMCRCQELESAIERCMDRITDLERRVSVLDDPFLPSREP